MGRRRKCRRASRPVRRSSNSINSRVSRSQKKLTKAIGSTPKTF